MNGVFTPDGILPEGVDVSISTNPYTGESGPARKGIIAATLNNVALLNSLLIEESSVNNRAKLQKIIDAICPLIPSLRIVGVFDFFTVEEWLSTETQPGRIFVAVLYLQQHPQKITPEIRERLKEIQSQAKMSILSETIRQVLAY